MHIAKRFTFLKILVFFLCMVPIAACGQTWFEMDLDSDDTVYNRYVHIDIISHHHNSWQIGKPAKVVFDTAYSRSNAIVTDTLNKYPPNDTSAFLLSVPKLYLTPYGWWMISDVSFYYKMDIDSGSFGMIEYSVDTGRTWHRAGNDYTGLHPDTLSFKASTVGWQLYQVGLLSLYDDTILLRFTFISDSDTACGDGWMIDDFHVQYWMEGVPMLQGLGYNIYPNPAHDIVGITATERIRTLAISNVMGQQVYQNTYNATDITTDIRQLPPGLYFVHINGTVAGKFLKE